MKKKWYEIDRYAELKDRKEWKQLEKLFLRNGATKKPKK